MNINRALIAFSALSQETRLSVFKLLIEYGKSGAPAGALSDQLDIPHNTLSFHLSHLAHAGLVTSRKQGRQMIYAANCDTVEGLIDYLKENCCVRQSPKATTGCIREGASSGCATECKPKPKKRTKS